MTIHKHPHLKFPESASSRPAVLVTGASGLIGSKLVSALAERYRVAALDVEELPAEVSGLPGVRWVHCDLTDSADVRQAIEHVREQFGEHLASVVHLAAYYDFSGEPSPLYERLTVDGTARLLAALKSLGNVQQFVFSSSLLVTKPVEVGETIDERSPLQAEWEYPESKLRAEAVIKQEHGTIPAVIVRLAGVYDEAGHSPPIVQQIARIYEKDMESYFFPGRRDHGQSFIHLEDAVDALVRIVDGRDRMESLEVFVVGEREIMSYEELQDRIGELIHSRRWPTMRIPKAIAKAGAWVKQQFADDQEQFIKPWMIDLADAHYPVDPAKLEARVGWHNKHSLRNTLPKIVLGVLDDPVHWYQTNGLSVPDEVAYSTAR